MRQTKTFPLFRASQVNAMHPYEIQPPGLVTAKNVYVSPSDNAVTLRHDYYTFRNDIPTIVDHWTGSTSEDKSDFLNILLTGPVYTDQQCITRLAPTGIGGTVLSSTYIDGTITTTGASSTVTGSGTTWVKNVWPGSFIQFAGSNNIYLIKLVESDTSLTVDGTPPALSGVTYKVYRTHDFYRGLYPGHFDQLANNYVYNMATPFDNDSETINSICGPFTMVKPISRVPEIQTVSITSETGDYGGQTSVMKFLSVARGASAYLLVGYTKNESNQDTLVFYSSTDGSTWALAGSIVAEFTSETDADIGENQVAFSKSQTFKFIESSVSLRYFSTDAYYLTFCCRPINVDGSTSGSIRCYIYKSSDGTSWSGGVPIGDKYNGVYSDISSNGSGTYVVVTSGAIWKSTDPTDSSTYTRTKTGASGFQTCVWNGTNFSVAGNSQAWYSSDGTAWLSSTGVSVPTILYRSSVGATNHVVSVGILGGGSTGKVIFRSTDNGVTWTKVFSVSEVGPLRDIIWDGTLGLYIAVGHKYSTVGSITTFSGVIYTSPDGTTWTLRTAPAGDYSLICVSSAGTHAIAAGNKKTIIRSTNGTTWSALEAQVDTPDIFDMIYEGGSFVLVGEGGMLATSADGSSWSFQRTNVGSTLALNAVVKTDTDYVIVGDTGTIITTSDFIEITARTSGVTVHLNGVAWDYVYGTSRLVVAVGNATGGAGIVLSTSDYITWTSRTSNTTKSLNDVCHDGSALFVAVGEDGAVITSANAVAWTARTSGTSEDLKSVCYARELDLFCSVGTAGEIITSADGVTWTSPTSPVSTQLNDVAWTNSKFVAAGEDGVVIESLDGVTWTVGDSSSSADINTVVAASDYQLLGADSGVVIKLYNSTLGSRWIPVSDKYRAAGFAVASGFLVLVGTSEFENGRWVYHPRRVRWGVPGTVDTWEGEGAGGSDLPGTGAVLDCRTLGYNIVLFESSQISVLNSTEDVYSPFSYQVIHSNMRAISNPLVVDQLCYFITPDGKLYRTNGFNVNEVCQPFDLTKYKDFDDAGPIWLVYDREIRRILCYRPRKTDTEHECFIIDPDNATVTVQILPDVTVAGGGYYQGASGINFARSLPQMPTDYKFISDLELDDKDGDGEPETPVRKPFKVRWLINDINHQGVTVVDYSHASMSGSVITVYIDGVPNALTEGSEWSAATSNDDTATSIASAIDALGGVSATAAAAVVTVVKSGDPVEIDITTDADAAGMVIDYDRFRSHCYSSSDAQFVICGLGGKVYTIASSAVAAMPTINDPSDCTERTSATTEDLLDSGYNGSYYICTGSNSTIVRSSDGVTWAAASAVATRVATDGIYAVLDSIYAPFILAGTNDSSTLEYYVLKSTDDGDNWTDTGAGDILAYEINFVNDLDGTMSYEIVDYSTLTGATVTVRIDGTNTVLTESVDWTAATSNDDTATSLAAAIEALTGVGATAASATVTVTADSTTTGLFLSTDAADITVTNSSRFWLIGGGAWESFDGVNWTEGNGITSAVQAIFYKNGSYYLTGENKWFYSPRDDVSTSRNWYEIDHPVDFSAGCGEIITGVDSSGPLMIIGTYETPEGYYYWTDTGARFFEIPKPTPPTNNKLEMWSIKWNGTYALALATDQV